MSDRDGSGDIIMPDGRPKPHQAMLDATQLCFPACNELSRSIDRGTLTGAGIVQTLRSLAYAIETIAAFQTNQYHELLHLTRESQQLKDRLDALQKVDAKPVA